MLKISTNIKKLFIKNLVMNLSLAIIALKKV